MTLYCIKSGRVVCEGNDTLEIQAGDALRVRKETRDKYLCTFSSEYGGAYNVYVFPDQVDAQTSDDSGLALFSRTQQQPMLESAYSTCPNCGVPMRNGKHPRCGYGYTQEQDDKLRRWDSDHLADREISEDVEPTTLPGESSLELSTNFMNESENFTNTGRDDEGNLIGNCTKCGAHGVKVTQHKCKLKEFSFSDMFNFDTTPEEEPEMSDEELIGHITNRLKQREYCVVNDEQLTDNVKRKVHDALMELANDGYLYFATNIHDDVFTVKRTPPVNAIKAALQTAGAFLNDIGYGERTYFDESYKIRRLTEMLEKMTGKKVKLR